MALNPRSSQEAYEIYKNEVQAKQPELTDFSDGSINDIKAGASVALFQEVSRILLDRFKLTYFNSAEGTDLDFLAEDHFGDKFTRPEATKSVGIVEFTRPNTDAGNTVIPAGTIVKTQTDANGEVIRYSTILSVTMTGTVINASIQAVEAGAKGNVEANSITDIESALTDPSIIVNNPSETDGGEAEQDDAEYRQTITNLIQSLKGATKAAVQAGAENVAGVENVSVIEFIQTVIEWNESTSMPIGEAFKIAKVKLYISDSNGDANNALIDNVIAAIADIRACGVFIEVLGATAFFLDWDASITLNPAGPNFASLQNDPQPIIDTMTSYLQDLSIGSNFNRALARLSIMNIWGPDGSNDLTDFVTNSPTGDVTLSENQKIIPQTIGLS